MRILGNIHKLCRVLLGVAFFTLHSSLFTSCTQDNYDKGEGEYSLMRADFVEAHVGNDQRVDYVVTDDGDSLAAEPHFTTKAIETADTTYRAILYYNKVKGSAGLPVVEAKGMSIVPTLVPALPELLGSLKTDPVKFESIWIGANRRYINASIILMTGTDNTEEYQYQSIAIINDQLITHVDGKRTLCCRLFHDQSGVPEYYSIQRYFSIPIQSLHADTLQLTINTYDGVVVKRISL